MSSRPTAREVLFEVARVIAKRGTCERAKVGALITMGGRIISTGYVGSPAGLAHCEEVGCEMVNGHCVRTTHAEANAITFAARHGVPTEGGELFCTHEPCLACAKLIINAGIRWVFYETPYGDHEGIALLVAAGVYVN